MIPLPAFAATRAGKVALIVGGVLLVVAAFLLWNWLDNRAAVEAANQKRIAAEARATLEAERRANAADTQREAERAQRSEQAGEAMRKAEEADPEGAAKPAGPVSQAALERLR